MTIRQCVLFLAVALAGCQTSSGDRESKKDASNTAAATGRWEMASCLQDSLGSGRTTMEIADGRMTIITKSYSDLSCQTPLFERLMTGSLELQTKTGDDQRFKMTIGEASATPRSQAGVDALTKDCGGSGWSVDRKQSVFGVMCFGATVENGSPYRGAYKILSNDSLQVGNVEDDGSIDYFDSGRYQRVH